ncbi:hypothetical protein [Serratia symbiotica]|uniref:hypothetical protein n=1 Tax=Serratia symbiotica TaxID=138074 RepID=UPI001323F42E|nr:hypothetical protein [Serratia symbiotica]QTP13380.1 hypothetical protein GPZ83_0000125 [Serratia symbiotica]
MKIIIAALIIGLSIIYAAAEIKPDAKTDNEAKAPETCIINTNDKIIYKPCEQ